MGKKLSVEMVLHLMTKYEEVVSSSGKHIPRRWSRKWKDSALVLRL